MAKRTDKDEMIDEAIGELIDDDSIGFYLTTPKKDGSIVSVHFDATQQAKVSEGLEIFPSTLKLYYHLYDTLRKIDSEYSEPVTIEDLFTTLMTVHEEITMTDETVVHELRDIDND